jgi:hypothetical protein
MNRSRPRASPDRADWPSAAADFGSVLPHPGTPLPRSPSFLLGSGHCRDRASQLIDPPEDVPDQIARHRNLGHLERDVAAMSDDLGADLDQLLPDGGERPMLDLLRQCQGPHEVGEVVGERMKLEADRVVVELAARQPRPLDGVLALLDPLFRRAALVLEGHDALGGTPQVGDDEADAGIELSRKRPIWLAEAACFATAPPPTIHRMAGSCPRRSASFTSS